MAKMTATETAQQVIDRAVQLFGGRGVARGEVSSASIAISARYASMKGPPKCRS